MKTWCWRTRDDLEKPKDFGKELGISPRLASILWNRGLSSTEELHEYLYPRLNNLEQPYKWPDIGKGAELLAEALLAGKKLAVWGDYDVDGVTGVSLAVQVLRHYGFDPYWHLPDRQTEGYGLNSAVIDELAAQGIEILLTVDCGIADCESVQVARDHNMLVIISDHHLSPENLPDAHALCNPRLGDCPCQNLAGVGVVFFLMAELNTLLSRRMEKEKYDMRHCLDLVALGTLADLVPLEGQNRILVKNGLLKIKEASRLGIAALKFICNFNSQEGLNPKQIVFNLAPRINAAGRVANARTAAELFLSTDKDESLSLARKLDAYNQERRKEERQITEEAFELAEKDSSSSMVFVMGENWNQGIVGIVASRLAEKYYKPAFVLCKAGDAWKGSARSIQACDLHAGLVASAEYLESFGGHRMAAGIRILPENVEKFKASFTRYIHENIGRSLPAEELIVDGEMNFAEVTNHLLIKEIAEMQPFGMGNSEPLFVSPSLLVRQRTLFGTLKNHVKLNLYDESTGISLNVKVWQHAHKYPVEMINKRIQIVFSPNFESSSFNTDYLIVKDWQYCMTSLFTQGNIT